MTAGALPGGGAPLGHGRPRTRQSAENAAEVVDPGSRQAHPAPLRPALSGHIQPSLHICRAMTRQEASIMKRNKLKLLPIVAIVASAALTVTVAEGASSKPKLSFVKSRATIQWTDAVGSSPGGGTSNANAQSLRIVVTVTTSPTLAAGASAYTYGANETLVDLRGRHLGAIDHLGFDSKGYLGAGAPRISLGTVDENNGNHQYFLSAYYCNSGEDTNGWRTSDFINGASSYPCTVFRDNVQMTWAAAVALADAAGEVVVSSPNDWFLNVDEGPSVTYIDRLSVQEWCWTGNGTSGIVNQNSGDCI